ncbi:MAG: hypothetical protein ACLUJG_01665 [Lawsonibacter sp.]
MEGPLLLQCGGQPGIAPGLPAVRPLQGQEVGVEIMGKEHRGLVGPRGPGSASPQGISRVHGRSAVEAQRSFSAAAAS